MKLLVGGGTGFIGQHLRKLVESRGHEMINITRKVQRPSDLTWQCIEKNGLPNCVDSVVNLQGINIMSPARWTEEFKRSLRTSRVETTQLLANAVKESERKPSSFIGISAIGYYGAEDRHIEITEDSPPGTDFAAKLCEDWERAALVDDENVRQVAVRVGLVLGRDGGTVASMYWPFFFGVGGSISDGKQWFPWIHVDDVTGIILHAIEQPTVSGTLNAVAPAAVTNADFTKIFARQMWRFAPFCIPKFVLSTLLGEERADMMASSPKISPVRTLESGYQFKYPDLQTACADVTRWQ